MVEIRARLDARPSALPGARPQVRELAAGTWVRAQGIGSVGSLRIWLREPLPASDLDALRRCAVDEAHWRTLPKLAQTRRSSVTRLSLSSGPVVVKRYIDPGAFRLRTFARRSRAEREARALDLVGSVIPENPVRVLAWAEERRFGFVSRGYVVTTELVESFDLRRVKELGAPQRDAAIRVVLEQLPRWVARLHAADVIARTLRGKNALLQPATGRIALIDLPYARAVARLGQRHRIRDLAVLSLELRRFLDAEGWNHFLASYRAEAGDLPARDVDRIRADRIERVAARLGHRTALSSATKAWKHRFRHSRIGQWVTGHRYPEEPE